MGENNRENILEPMAPPTLQFYWKRVNITRLMFVVWVYRKRLAGFTKIQLGKEFNLTLKQIYFFYSAHV